MKIKKVENTFDDGIVEVSFADYYKGEQVLYIQIGEEGMPRSFIGKFESPRWIAKYIQEGNLDGLIQELEFGKRAELEAHYYLLGYRDAKRAFQREDNIE